MRIDKLSIKSYRNLQNFEIDFDESQPTTVLLGRNGSGKSNLIEALVEIFRELESGGDPPFAYVMEYLCHGYAIRIDANPERTGKQLDISVDGKSIAKTMFRRGLHDYLPNFVFAYYSGWSNRLERQFDDSTRKHYYAILNAKPHEPLKRAQSDSLFENDDFETRASNLTQLRRMFFCRKEYSQLVLLAFFLSGSYSTRKLLEKYLKIEGFESALFVLKRPYWGSGGKPSKVQRETGDPRFWYARGAFQNFLSRLWECAFAPLRSQETIERDIRRQGESTERLYLYIKNNEVLSMLQENFEDTKTVFGHLESLFLCDLIDEVRVTVVRTDGTRVKFTQLSEGEQQLLTVLGLLLFTQNDESLYLLDEPDTHLNPVWTYDFLKLLEEHIQPEKGQLLIATHNPLMIGSLRKNQVRLIESTTPDDGESFVVANEPNEDPFAMGVDGLLTSELYGLPSILPKQVVAQIDERNKLFAIDDRTPEQEAALLSLSDELAKIGVLRSYTDPYEQAFVEALARRRDKETEGLSAEQIRQRNADADAILNELFAEEESGIAIH